MQKRLRVAVLSLLGVCTVAGLAWAAGTTTDYILVSNSGGAVPGNNEINFENSARIEFRSYGIIISELDNFFGAQGDTSIFSNNEDVTLSATNGSVFVSAQDIVQLSGADVRVNNAAVIPGVASYTPAAATTVNVDAYYEGLINIQMPAAGGAVTIGVPTNPTNGQRLIYRIKQGATTPGTITWSGTTTNWRFGNGTGTLTATVSKTDYFEFIYNSVSSHWDCVNAAKNY